MLSKNLTDVVRKLSELKVSFNCFQCNKLDSWENLLRLGLQNKTLGNHTYLDYLKVKVASHLASRASYSRIYAHL